MSPTDPAQPYDVVMTPQSESSFLLQWYQEGQVSDYNATVNASQYKVTFDTQSENNASVLIEDLPIAGLVYAVTLTPISDTVWGEPYNTEGQTGEHAVQF
jgi:hypothetical protein